MKKIKYFLASSTILIVLFFIWAWYIPVNIGWKVESPVGYYKFNVVVYALNNGRPDALYVIETIGNTPDFFAHIFGIKKLDIDRDW